MNLNDALQHVFHESKRITRRVWNNPRIYCSLVDARLCITGVDADGKPHPWTVTESDWFAEDWEVVE